MTDYRCYCLDAAGHIHDATLIVTDSDAQARERGAQLLEGCRHVAVEIWDGDRCVGQVTRPQCTTARSQAVPAAAGCGCRAC